MSTPGFPYFRGVKLSWRLSPLPLMRDDGRRSFWYVEVRRFRYEALAPEAYGDWLSWTVVYRAANPDNAIAIAQRIDHEQSRLCSWHKGVST